MPEVTSEIDKERLRMTGRSNPEPLNVHECFHTLEHIVHVVSRHSAAD